MTLAWAVIAVIALTGLFAVTKLLRRLVWAFALAFGALLFVHFQTNPAEAATAGAALGGSLLVASPLRALLLRWFF
ncbi:MAG: hypothetical protein EBS68_01530 [Rhodobacteraceae bacterium]|jgi:hypothetical protein|nr:hypothetical protein [Paracoccaceae bacterium]